MRRTPLAAVMAAVLALAACGGDDDDAVTEATDVSLVPATPPSTVPVPEVSLPAEAPTELAATTIVEGSGRAAEDGDAVVVRYVGRRFEDGEVFDSNYGGEPLTVTLGAGGVIAGWDQGLVGAQTGEQLQLDIPADLAYGATPTSEAGAAGGRPTGPLSFVVDVLAVFPPGDPADAPTQEDIPTSEELHTDVVTEDLVVGDGPTVDAGMIALIRFVLARADNGTILRSTWDDPAPTQLVMAPSGQMDGMLEGMVGMKVGGRRAITVPFVDAFGEEGFPEAGLPARTDAVVVVDLVGAY
jgi:peptidylprolyl isomerase